MSAFFWPVPVKESQYFLHRLTENFIMSESLQKVWQQIEWYLKENISVIPVADRVLTYRGETLEPKTPLVKWTPFTKRIIKKEKMKEQLQRSPDYLDMLIMRMYFMICEKEAFWAI